MEALKKSENNAYIAYDTKVLKQADEEHTYKNTATIYYDNNKIMDKTADYTYELTDENSYNNAELYAVNPGTYDNKTSVSYNSSVFNSDASSSSSAGLASLNVTYTIDSGEENSGDATEAITLTADTTTNVAFKNVYTEVTTEATTQATTESPVAEKATEAKPADVTTTESPKATGSNTANNQNNKNSSAVKTGDPASETIYKK
ncbi:MAG: hypothetical protein K6E10_05360 [Eubacterium sp.]|nr:hypothetical protein [Eubacterium sp.]